MNPQKPQQPVPQGRLEDDAIIPDDDDPWLEEEELEDEGQHQPRRPLWNR